MNWINPSDLKILKEEERNSEGSSINLMGVKYSKDLLLTVKKLK